MMNKYHKVFEHIIEIRRHASLMRMLAGRVNLPDLMTPKEANEQLDAVEYELTDAELALDEARTEVTQAWRRGLAVV